MNWKLVSVAIFLLLPGCTTIDQVKASHSVYCSTIYKNVRSIGRAAVSATSGILIPDVCDTIEDVVAEETEE